VVTARATALPHPLADASGSGRVTASASLADNWQENRPLWRAVWGARADDPAVVASSVRQTLDALERLGGVFAGPWSVVDGGPVPPGRDELTELVTASRERDDRGAIVSARGHRMQFVTLGIDSADEPFAQLSLSTASTVVDPRRPRNSVTLRVEARGAGGRVYGPLADVAADVSLLLARVWHPDVVELLDSALVDAHVDLLHRPGSWPRIGPVTYLSARAYPAARELSRLSVASTTVEENGTLIVVGTPGASSATFADCLTTSREVEAGGALGPVPAECSRATQGG
jgi:hypothetical protein